MFVDVSHREKYFQLRGRNTVITASPIYQVWFVTVAQWSSGAMSVLVGGPGGAEDQWTETRYNLSHVDN